MIFQKGFSLIFVFLVFGTLVQANQNAPNLQQLRRFARHMFPARVSQADVPVSVDNSTSTGLKWDGKCQFGYLPGNSGCLPFICLALYDCSNIFGSNSICNLSTSSCECDSTHSLDSLTQSCSLPKIPTLSCQSSDDCSTMSNSVCMNGACKCTGDYLLNSNGACERVRCNESLPLAAQCTAQFGPKGVCKGLFCGCDYKYQLDLSTRKCVPISSIPITPVPSAITPAGKRCGSESNCGQNAKCKWNDDVNALEYQCVCNLGYKAYGGQCLKMYCGDDQQCKNTFGDNTRCRKWGCECDSNSVPDTKTEKCVSTKYQINQFCNWDSECGTEAMCLNHQCKCRVGFDSKDNTNCGRISCSSKYDCINKNDNTDCFLNQCQCDDKAGYSLDSTTQQCTANSIKLGDFCKNDLQCGSNAKCVFNSCQCQAFYSPMENSKEDCKLADCTFTSECRARDFNSVCEFSSCSCATGYNVDSLTQKCNIDLNYYNHNVYDDDDDDAMSTARIALGITSLVLIIMGVIGMIMKARQSGQLGARTSGGSSASSGKAATAVVNAKIAIPQKS